MEHNVSKKCLEQVGITKGEAGVDHIVSKQKRNSRDNERTRGRYIAPFPKTFFVILDISYHEISNNAIANSVFDIS